MRIFNLCLFFIFFQQNNVFAETGIDWQNLSQETFKKAEKEHKLILLNLKANWCHWCHVMEDSTYSNTQIITYINKNFIAVEADQAANPELSNRYKNYGWPATIFINAQGEDVAKRSGYIAPQYFLKLLKAIVADPSPEETLNNLATVSTKKTEDAPLLNALKNRFIKTLDITNGGYNQSQKYVAYDPFEYALFSSQDAPAKLWIKNSIKGAKQLCDPAWGGMYQYSTNNDWKHLHFEKLLAIQARYINLFLLNYYYNNDDASLDCAKQIIEYCNRFLASDNGLYYNAQDADLIPGKHAGSYFALNDKDRVKQGVPKIDTHIYTDNNAKMGVALIKLWRATNNKTYYNKAETIKQKLLLRKMNSGLFSHDKNVSKIASLKDQIAMLGFLIEWIKNDISDTQSQKELIALCKAIQENFTLKNGALKSFSGNNGLVPLPLIEENIKIARLFNWCASYTKNKTFYNTAKNCYRFLISSEVSKNYYSEPTLIMLSNELQKEPVQYVYLNRNKGNSFNNPLHVMLPFYSIIYDGTLKQLPEEKQELISNFNENVLFMCTSTYCSSPVVSKTELYNTLMKNQKNK